jgi:hypothetical protein
LINSKPTHCIQRASSNLGKVLRGAQLAVRVTLFSMAVVWLASQWNPSYVNNARFGPLQTTENEVLVSARGSLHGVVLTLGKAVRQSVVLPDVPHIDGSVERVLCVTPFVVSASNTFGLADGEVNLNLGGEL